MAKHAGQGNQGSVPDHAEERVKLHLLGVADGGRAGIIQGAGTKRYQYSAGSTNASQPASDRSPVFRDSG